MLKIHKLPRTQWALHKKFKNFLLHTCNLNLQIYKSHSLDKLFILFTKLIIFSNKIIKSEYILCHTIKYKKKKFSVVVVENYKKFVLQINLKANNILI